MKVLLLGFVRIAHMPYMYDYVRLLGGTNELHLVSWNRNGRPDAAVPKGISKSFVFGDHVEDADPIQKKLPHFARFRKFALGVIDSEGYDRIVVLHSTPGITILDRLKWRTTTRDSSAAPRRRGSSDRDQFSWRFVGWPDCGGAVCAHEFKIGGKKFLVNHARL